MKKLASLLTDKLLRDLCPSMARTKDTTRKCFPKQKEMSSRRKSQIFSETSEEEKKNHDLGPFLTNHKIVYCSRPGQGIFEDLKALRPRT